MELEINLPDHGSFTNKAGQLVEFWLDPKDKTKCKIRVDGKPIDWFKYLESEAQRLGELKEITEAVERDNNKE